MHAIVRARRAWSAASIVAGGVPPATKREEALRSYLAAVEDRCLTVLGLSLRALAPIDVAAAFDARLSPATAFEELVLGSLRRGVHRTRFRLFGTPSTAPANPLTARDFAAVTAVLEPRPPPVPEVPMGTWIDFKDLRARVSLEDVVVRMYGITTLAREGAKLAGPCPVHGGDSPRAFHADLAKNVWHCFSKCQGGGNQIDFVAKKEKVGIRDAALKMLAAFPAGDIAAPAAPVPTTAPTRPIVAKEETPAAPQAKKAAEEDEASEEASNVPLSFRLQLRGDHPHLVEERKLKPETIAQFGVGYCARGILRGMVAIPVHDEDGDLVAYVGRRMKAADIREHGKYKLPKGFRKERVLFNLHRAKSVMAEQGLVVVEGFFTAMKLAEAGFPGTVACMGLELSSAQAEQLRAAKDLVVLFAGSEASQAGADAIRASLGAELPVRVCRLPKGTKPSNLDPRFMRWLINGMRALDLLDVSFTPNVR